jgi:UDP-N-acetylmuramoyl-tripeptide--D-alanyl-D-alanine ligase
MQIEKLYQLFLDSKGICTDTRKIEVGTIFFALKGDNFNGNKYAQNALDEGCIYAVVDEEKYLINENCILVDNVLNALQQLANHHRQQFDIPILGITGSNGKTTTKELIGAVLSKKFNVLMTQGNLNNHLGVPFTLLRLTKEHDFAIVEMGASKIGDIQELVEIAEPNYGIITNVGIAHLEGFGSLDGVIEAKTELYRWIEGTQGKLFFNAEDSILCKHLPAVENSSYGEDEGNVQGKLIELNPFVTFSWKSNDYQSPEIETKLVGKYNFTNFLAAVSIGNYFEVLSADINAALSNYTPSNNRSQVQKTERNTLIVDCYNANPTSMYAAISSFNEVNAAKKLMILGDMLELGTVSLDEHQKIVDAANQSGSEVILVGNEFGKTNSDFDTYMDFEALIENEHLSDLQGFLILLKGSRGIKLENLISHL